MPGGLPDYPANRARRVLRCLLAPVLALTSAPVWAEPVSGPVMVAQAAELESPVDEEELEAAAAEPDVAPPSDVEVIRIKGRGVSAIETDVPASVTQFDAAAIEALGAENISDLAKVTPNVEIRTAGSTAATFFIRGVGLSDFSANAAGAVAIYQDGVPKNAPAIQLGQLFDLENVEVLRGPQAISGDRNASAGSIKIYSRRPSGELTAQLRSSVGAYGSDLAHSGLIQDYEGALEAPIVEESLSARLAFRFRVAEPYQSNGCSGQVPSYEERGLERRPFHRPGNSQSVVVVDFTRARDFVGDSFCNEGTALLDNVNRPPGPARLRLSTLPGGLPARVGDQGNWSARGQLRFQPTGSEMDWLLNLHGGRLDQQSTLGQAIGTGTGAVTIFGGRAGFPARGETPYTEPDSEDELAALQAAGLSLGDAQEVRAANLAEGRPLDIRPYRGDYNRVGQTRLDSWGAVLRGDMSFGPVNLTTISGYDTYDRFRETDQDFTPNLLFENIETDDAWQFSQELRFSGELADTPFRWEAGGYYLMETLHFESTLFGNIDTNRVFDQDTWSFAFFGNIGWDFLDDFTLEGGVRYNWDRKLFDFARGFGAGTGDPVITEKTWSAPTGSVSLSYRFREDVSAYWKYTRGWKPGSFNAQTTRSDQTSVADPETIDAFEVGLRGRWLDGRLALGGALFHYQYRDYQVFLVTDNQGSPPVLEIVNAEDAEIYGAEIDMTLEPLAGWAPQLLDGLVLTGRFGWLESQFLDFTNEVIRSVGTASNTVNIPLTVDFSGNQLINSPRFKVSASAEWTFDLGRWGALVPRYDLAWSDDNFFDASEGRGSPNNVGNPELPEFAVGQPAFLLQNFRLAYRTPEGNIEIAGWVRNLTDVVYKSYAFDASNFANVVINFTGQPRTFGVDLSINW